MNIAMIMYFLGWVLGIEGVFMLLPCVVAVIYQETTGFYFLAVAAVCGLLGFLLGRKKPENTVFYAREGFVSVALSWIVLSFFGALPFYFSGEIPVFIDALFEVVSGFTTTGASILPNVELLSRCMLIWRSFTHWIGGMGVLVFILAVLPLAGGYNMHIMRAESPGPSVGKLVPKVRTTAKILYLMYFSLTVAQIIILLCSGMYWFDALALSFGTAGTGGFGVLADSCASYTIFQQSVITIFMILFGVNFNVYYLFIMKKWKEAVKCEEMRIYFGIIIASVLLVAIVVYTQAVGQFDSFPLALHHSAFQIASIITTTGYATVDFDLWPTLAKSIIVCLMFIGACAGSTGGGTKISRAAISFKSMRNELASLIHPRSVKTVKFEEKPVHEEIIKTIHTYYIAYIVIFAVSVLFISLENYDPTTNFTAIAATLNNVGPGLSAVGPNCNFAFWNPLSKIVMIFDMLAGRLEVFPMLILFSINTWRKE